VLLSAQHVEVVGGGRGDDYLQVALLDVHSRHVLFDVDCTLVRVHQLKESLYSAGGVFRALAVVAMGQVEHDA